jgi:hypothetical protein
MISYTNLDMSTPEATIVVHITLCVNNGLDTDRL